MKLSGNTVLITGGTSGIGLELTRQLLAKGNWVIVTGRDQAKLKKAKDAFPQIETIQSDVAKPEEIVALEQKVTKSFPELNVLINNAGIMRTINLQSHKDGLAELTREIETNLIGPVRMTQQFLRHLKTRPSSAIVNVSSGLAFVPLPTSPVYCATKAAIHSFTLSLRVQLQRTNVRVFELAPPATATELLASFDPEDMKGAQIMKVDAMVAAALEGIERDHLEIRPGQANQLKFMSRLAPQFILKMMSKPVDRMLSNS
jgi:uncharacterized oxidoreductase